MQRRRALRIARRCVDDVGGGQTGADEQHALTPREFQLRGPGIGGVSRVIGH